MTKFNTDEISALLHIHEKSLGHPRLNNIREGAMNRLNEINSSMEPNAEGGVMNPGPQIYAAPNVPAPNDASKGESAGDMAPTPHIVRRTEAPSIDDPSKQGSG